MSDKGLLEIARRLVVDRDFRERFLIAPQDVLSDLGVSPEAYRALLPLVPILLAGGIGLMDSALGSKPLIAPPVGWGR